MNKVLKYEPIDIVELDKNINNILNEHLKKRKASIFEVYENFTLVSFDWYDVKYRHLDFKRILLY